MQQGAVVDAAPLEIVTKEILGTIELNLCSLADF
jgi:hypothetical protein